MYCLEHGILSGTSATAFSPSAPMTRALLAAGLYQMSDAPAVSASPTFSDIAADAWCADAAVWASENGIISGYGNGLFGADDTVTREQMAAILWRYAGSPSSGTTADFADRATISTWAVPAVDWAEAQGVITGQTEHRFAPKDHITRVEAAVMLYRWRSGGGDEEEAMGNKILVAYFSATGATRPLPVGDGR